jgi:V/A-type H+/Na+-transporting ATPase subunit K
MNRRARVLVLAAALLAGAAAAVSAQDTAAAAPSGPSGLAVGLIALAAALAVGLTALATAIAQGRIGAAGAGTIAEKPEAVGSILLMLALPETMVILGFVVAIIILFVR